MVELRSETRNDDTQRDSECAQRRTRLGAQTLRILTTVPPCRPRAGDGCTGVDGSDEACYQTIIIGNTRKNRA